jgi:hypothetical protein
MDLRKMIAPIEWTAQGRCRFPAEEARKRIAGLITSIYGIPEAETAPIIKMYEWGSFYRPDGAKITKSLQTIVRKFKSKEETLEHFSVLGKHASELYEPDATYTVAFGDKTLLGEGTYEGRKTCFGEGQMNEHNKHFLSLYRRVGMLTISAKDPKSGTKAVARCIVYFAGNRNVFLFNFYYNGIPQNKHLFIEAYRRIMKMDKVTWKDCESGGFFLPVYRNTRSSPSSPVPAVHIYDARAKFPKLSRKFPCPFCRKEFLETEIYWQDEGSQKYGACSRLCYLRGAKRLAECPVCRKEMDTKTGHGVIVNGNVKHVCPECFYTKMTPCSKCDHRFVTGTLVKDDMGLPICKGCFASLHRCEKCGLKKAKVEYRSSDEGKIYCIECYSVKKNECGICRISLSSSQSPRYLTIYGNKIKVCNSCHDIYVPYSKKEGVSA